MARNSNEINKILETMGVVMAEQHFEKEFKDLKKFCEDRGMAINYDKVYDEIPKNHL
jgi:hypothetical protein